MKNLQILILENGISAMSFPKNRLKVLYLTPKEEHFLRLTLPFDGKNALWLRRSITNKIKKLSISGTFCDPVLSFLELPPPQDPADGYHLYKALLASLASVILKLIFPFGGQRVVLDCTTAESIFPLVASLFRELVILCSDEQKETYRSLLLSSYGIAPIFTQTVPPCDFFITDQKLCSSDAEIACALCFAGYFPHATRSIDHNRIMLRPQNELRTALPNFIREVMLSEGAALLSANDTFSSNHFLPRPLFAL